MKTRSKRAISLMLALCLIMGLMIPVAWAEEATVAKKTVEYSFLYLDPLGYTGTVYYNKTDPNKGIDYLPAMEQAYNDSKLNSMIVTGSFYSVDAGMALTSTSITKGSLYPGAWLGFKIKSPGDGAFDVAVVPSLSSNGTKLTTTPKGLAVYVLEVDDNTSIEAAMNEAQIGSDVNLNGKDAAQTAGSYNFTAGKDYYVVLKMTKDKTGGTTAGSGTATAITLAGLQMTKACADAEDTAAQITNAPLGSTITLQADCDAAGKTITVNSGVTLDLNGKTLTADTVVVMQGGEVNINSGTLNAQLDLKQDAPEEDPDEDPDEDTDSPARQTLLYNFGYADTEGMSGNMYLSNYNFALGGPNAANKSTYLGMSHNVGYMWGASQFRFRFQTYGANKTPANFSDAENRSWGAIQIDGVSAGMYDLAFGSATYKVDEQGLGKVYVLSLEQYQQAIAGYEDKLNTADKPLYKADNDVILGKAEAAMLNDPAKAVIGGDWDSGDYNENRDLGQATFPADGSYVLVFECLGSLVDTNTVYQIKLSNLTMKPVVASGTVGDSTVYYYSADEFVAAINGAASGTYQLLDDLNTDANITLQSGVTLDLNGKTLVAKTVCKLDDAQILLNNGTLQAEVYQAAAADKAAADAVQAKIDAIGDVTLDDEAAIADADAAYNALTDKQKALVNAAPLTAAKQELEQLKAQWGDAQAVQEQINAIGDVTLADEPAINQIAAAYLALTDAQQTLVDTTKLVAARKKLGELKYPGITVDNSEALAEDGIAAMNAVSSVNLLIASTSVVNGHDYMYMLFSGDHFMTYDLDEGKIIDIERNCMNTPRHVYVDHEGIVWVVGDEFAIFRYDPYTLTGEYIQWPVEWYGQLFGTTSFNAHGITGDGKGKLYFGTYNRTYVGMFDTETRLPYQISEQLNPTGLASPDGERAAFGGAIYKDGYLYMTVDGDINSDGDRTNVLIKYNVATNEIVDYVDLEAKLGKANWLEYMVLVGDVILGNTYVTNCSVAIDISGEKMKLVEIGGDYANLNGAYSAERNGKVYAMNGDAMGLMEYDIATGSVKQTGIAAGTGGGSNSGELRCISGTQGWVTVDHPDLPGESLVTFINGGKSVNLVFYNLETEKTVTWEDVTDGRGSGNSLNCVEGSPNGKQIYIGAYGNNQVAIYDVESGKIVKLIPTSSDQIEALIYYDGYLYAGNYAACAITKVDIEKETAKAMSDLHNTPFFQNRIFAHTSGGGKVFFGTAAGKSNYGGMLQWYDVQEDRVYVATGPNPEDVYYCKAGVKTWYKATTGELINLDFNGNGTVDKNDGRDADGNQIFTGVIANQTPCYITYVDGYIYGCTSKSNGSGTVLDKYPENPVLFVYDVVAMKLVATHDISLSVPGLATPIRMVDFVAEDPDVPGKFWGAVSETLFSFTFDPATKLFDVNVELSFGVSDYVPNGSSWFGRDVMFDGDFMYVSLGNEGTYMIERANPKNYYKLSDNPTKHAVLGADGNIYYRDITLDLEVLYTAEVIAEIKDAHGAEKTQALINALKDADIITLADEAAVLEARKSYDNLSDNAKQKLQNAQKLFAAEEVLAQLNAAADQAAAAPVIEAINGIGAVTVESEAAITAARAAYEALTENQKKLVTNIDVLITAEQDLAYAKADPADAEAALAVEAKIAAIGKVTRYSGEAVEAAQSVYDALTKEQAALVRNADVLKTAAAAYEAIMEEVLTKYYYDVYNHGLSLGGNALDNQKVLDNVKALYDAERLTWYVNSVKFSQVRENPAQFVNKGYLMARTVPGDWMAFTMRSPGAGKYELSLSYAASFCGAELVEIYILPADTQDIEAAMTEQYLIGTYNCYDPTFEVEKVEATAIRTMDMGTWIASDAEEYILVLRCAKANEDAVANRDTRYAADPENTRDFGADIYITELVMACEDKDVLNTQAMIDAIGTVTLNSEEAIKAARAAYDALTADQKKLIDTSKLTAAETKLEELKAAAEKEVAKKTVKYSFSYVDPLGYTGTVYYNKVDPEKGIDYLPAMEQAYNDSKINSMIVTGSFYSDSAGMALSSYGITKSSLEVGAWLGFKIKSPGEGAFDVAVVPREDKKLISTARGIAVYVLEATDSNTVSDALNEAKVGNDVQLYGNTTAQSAGSYSFTAGKDYYVVLKITADTSGATTGKSAITLSGLQMSKTCADATDTAAQISNAPLGSTITLSAACDAGNAAVKVGVGVTVDMNGHNLTANVNIVSGGSLIDSAATPGVLTGTLAASGNNGGYLPLKNGTGYSFYAAAVNVASAADGKLKFNVTFTNTDAYALLAADTSAQIGGKFAWTVNGEEKTQSHDISYATGVSLAQKWGQEVVNHNYASGNILLTFTGLVGFDALSVAPYITSAGVTIQADVQTLKAAS